MWLNAANIWPTITNHCPKSYKRSRLYFYNHHFPVTFWIDYFCVPDELLHLHITLIGCKSGKSWCTICAGTCSQWTSEDNTNYAEGERVSSANTVSECQQACINNASCNGVDFVPNADNGQKCWMSGTWSGAKGTANGVTHYNLNRDCGGKKTVNFVSL